MPERYCGGNVDKTVKFEAVGKVRAHRILCLEWLQYGHTIMNWNSGSLKDRSEEFGSESKMPRHAGMRVEECLFRFNC